MLEALVATVRTEFATEVIHVDPDDPVFGRGRCTVAGCERTAWTRRICTAHYGRWRHRGQPDFVEYCATTGPITSRPGSHMVDAFDLSALALQPRLEVAYILQCCHDDRRIRVPPSIIRHVVGLLHDTGVTSLLDRALDHWLGTVAARNWSDPSRTVGLLRYSYRHLVDLGAGIDIEPSTAPAPPRVPRLRPFDDAAVTLP